MFTQNDYRILQSIIDKDEEGKGLVMTKGTTKQEIIKKTGLSTTKITSTLLTFEANELIKPALKVKNAKSYIITDKGSQEIISMKGMV